jgi:hypothetical protein
MGVETESLSTNDWREFGMATGAAAALSLFLAYLFGGYVAGRMARRAGMLHGALVFIFGILLVAGVAAAIGSQADADAVTSNLRSMGLPTSGEEYAAIGTFAGLGAIVAMLLGSLLGGSLGERWHGKLVARALDPAVGPATSDEREPVAVRGDGRHFRAGDDDEHGADVTTADRARQVDVRDKSTTLDDDLFPEKTRTLH